VIKRLLPYALILLVVGMAFLPPLLRGDRSILGNRNSDVRLQFYAWRGYARDSLLQGDLPEWNPYALCGTPFLSGSQSALFYPPNLLFLLLPVRHGLNLSVLLHVILAAFGAAACVRRANVSWDGQVLAGVSFALSAPFLWRTYAGHLTILCTAAWLPWCILALEGVLERPQRRRIVLAALPVALAGTAGHPQCFLILLVGMGLYASSFVVPRLMKDRRLWRSHLAPLFVVFLGGALAAVQLVPSAVVSPEMIRSTETAMERWGESSFPFEGALTCWMPYLFGDLDASPYWGRWYLWECNAYVGIVALILAVGAVSVQDPRRRGLLLLCVGGLFLSLGKYNPLLSLVVNGVPPLKMFRGAAKFLLLPALGVSCLAGIGLQRVVGENVAPGKRAAIFALIPGLLALFFFCFFSTSLAERFVDEMSQLVERYDPSRLSREGVQIAVVAAKRAALRGFLFACLVGMIVLPWPGKLWQWLGPSFRKGALLFLSVVDLLLFAGPAVDTFDESICHWPQVLLQMPSLERSRYRIAAPGWGLPNQLMVHFLRTPEGYDVNLPIHSSRYLALATGRPERSADYLVQLVGANPLVEALGVRYFLSPEQMPIHVKEVGRSTGCSLRMNKKALPRARFVYRYAVCQEVEEEAQVLQKLDLKSAILVDRPLSFAPCESEEKDAPVSWLVDSPDEQVLQVHSDREALLFLADTYASGWSVSVDGEPKDLLRANMGFRAVQLSPGSHEVTFRYRTPGLLFGLLLTGVACLICLVWII